MFGEVALLPKEYYMRRFHHHHVTQEIVYFRMTRLIFGVTTSLYLASACLNFIHMSSFPIHILKIRNHYIVH